MYGDPVTWSTQERIARCREQADSFQKMADSECRFIGRDRLTGRPVQLLGRQPATAPAPVTTR